MHAIAQDLRLTLRRLGKSPGFALPVILTFAVGIGAATAIFSLVEGILLRPLPFAHPDRLVLLGDRLGSSPNTTVTTREIGTYSNATRALSSLVAIFSQPPKIDLFRFFWRELQLRGARVYEPEDFEAAIALAASGTLPLDRIITSIERLETLSNAMHQLEQGGPVMKILVQCSND